MSRRAASSILGDVKVLLRLNGLGDINGLALMFGPIPGSCVVTLLGKDGHELTSGIAREVSRVGLERFSRELFNLISEIHSNPPSTCLSPTSGKTEI